MPTWLQLHVHALACFDAPQVQSTYRECAAHYGFLLAPCRPRTPAPRGKVEQGGVHSAKQKFLGGRVPTLIPLANVDVRHWCLTTAEQRIHGTTKEAPLHRFAAVERGPLKPLPTTPNDVATWTRVTLPRDGYGVFERAFYAAPFRLFGQPLWVRGGSQEVRLHTTRYELVVTHPRAPHSGVRVTHPDHLPPEKIPGAFGAGRPVAPGRPRWGPDLSNAHPHPRPRPGGIGPPGAGGAGVSQYLRPGGRGALG